MCLAFHPTWTKGTMAQTHNYSHVNICRRRPSGFRETELLCLLCHGALTHMDEKSGRRSNTEDLLPTKSRGRLLCQGQGNELVVNRRQLVAASGWTQNAARMLHPMISHSLLLSGSSFSVESTDSRWDNMKRTSPAAQKNTYCPTAAPRENPGRFREVEFY
jgi:hypothetical protein